MQKLDNIAHIIVKNITSSDYKLIKEKLPLPMKDMETGLYTWDSNLAFYANLVPTFKNIMRK